MSLRKDGADGSRPFQRVLIANRGEIAVRIIRACREMGMEAVAVYSDADVAAAHVRLADVAVRIGGPAAIDSYLREDALVAAAIAAGAEAIHPGYGFLAERASFARAIEAAGLAFVGPSSTVIETLGDKLNARRIARDAGVPIVPGTLEPAQVDRPDQVESLLAAAEEVGFPLLVKASAGGGGRGMRRVEAARELPAALAAGSREAAASFGDGSVYLEREISRARHIEVQLLGDATGAVVAIGERDCSLQRRHQKLVEEAPAPGLSDGERLRLHELAVRVGSAAGLRNVATVEFLRDRDGSLHFLEVNTRLQVEHGITELVTGLDIVREQFWLAAGRPLSPDARRAAERSASPFGHAIEVRLSAEHPGRDFAPAPGTISRWRMPDGPGVRVDTAIESGERVSPEYDNLIAKVMVYGPDRAAAIDRLRRALGETEIAGIQTTLPFDRFVATAPSFIAGDLSTTWVVDHWDGRAEFVRAAADAQLAAGLAASAEPSATSSPRGRSGGGSSDGRWRRLGLEAATNRWPR